MPQNPPDKAEIYKKTAEAFAETAAVVGEIRKRSGSTHEEILETLADPAARAEICGLIDKAKKKRRSRP